VLRGPISGARVAVRAAILSPCGHRQRPAVPRDRHPVEVTRELALRVHISGPRIGMPERHMAHAVAPGCECAASPDAESVPSSAELAGPPPRRPAPGYGRASGAISPAPTKGSPGESDARPLRYESSSGWAYTGESHSSVRSSTAPTWSKWPDVMIGASRALDPKRPAAHDLLAMSWRRLGYR
jgi:hypothetical protein